MMPLTEEKQSQLHNPVSTNPSIEEWIATNLANSVTKSDMFGRMLASGWQSEHAAQALNLSHEERLTLGVPVNSSDRLPGQAIVSPVDPAIAFQQAIALKPVPRPLLNPDRKTVDAGDRSVKVLYHRQAPDLMYFHDFLSDEECDALIELSQPKLTRSTTVDGATGSSKVHEARTSFGTFFRREENELITRIEARIAVALSWPITHGEGLQVLHYLPGAEYKPHFDYFAPHEPGSSVTLKHGGQRVGTLLMYLNTPDVGGFTVFPNIGFSVAPKRGQALFFSYAQAHPCSLSLHGGEPVIAGEKWVATKWLRENTFCPSTPLKKISENLETQS